MIFALRPWEKEYVLVIKYGSILTMEIRLNVLGCIMNKYIYSENDWSWRIQKMKRDIEIDPEYFTPFERDFIRTQSAVIRPSEKQGAIQDKIWEKAKRR